MSYQLIVQINRQLSLEVPRFFFPFQYGTVGAFLSALLIPHYGSRVISRIQEDFQHGELNVDEGSVSDLSDYLVRFDDSRVAEAIDRVFQYIKKEYYGNLRRFFQGEVWMIDSQMASSMEGFEEYRDSLLLFVFSVPVFPVSTKMREVMTDFHIFEPEEDYGEVQSILNEYFTETPKCQRSYLAWKYLDTVPPEQCSRIVEKLSLRVPFTCDGCGRDIKGVKSPFITRVEVYPSRHLKFDYEDFEDRDFEKEMNRILEGAGQKSEKEMSKSVWTEYRLFLCMKCRNTFVRRIESGEFI
jgi:hypothetical protein